MVSKRPRPESGGTSRESARVRDRFQRLLDAGLAISSRRTLAAVLQQAVHSAPDAAGARHPPLRLPTHPGDPPPPLLPPGAPAPARPPTADPPRGRGPPG